MNQAEALSRIKRGQHTHVIRCFLDSAYPELIEIGDDCIIVDTRLLCHDAPSRVLDGLSPLGRIIIGNNVGVGTGATILYGSVIGDGCLIGGGAFITPGTVIPDGEFWGGVPARRICSVADFIERRRRIMERQTPVTDYSKLAPGQLYYRRLSDDDLVIWMSKKWKLA